MVSRHARWFIQSWYSLLFVGVFFAPWPMGYVSLKWVCMVTIVLLCWQAYKALSDVSGELILWEDGQISWQKRHGELLRCTVCLKFGLLLRFQDEEYQQCINVWIMHDTLPHHQWKQLRQLLRYTVR